LKKNTNYTKNEESFIITVEVVSTHEGEGHKYLIGSTTTSHH